MNKPDKEFIRDHIKHIESTITLLQEKNLEFEFSKLEQIGVATLLMNFYTGVENILKELLLARGVKIAKTSSWHKDILSNAVSLEIITDNLRLILLDYLIFRHYHTHGYGYMIKWEQVKQLAVSLPDAVAVFFQELKCQDYL